MLQLPILGLIPIFGLKRVRNASFWQKLSPLFIKLYQKLSPAFGHLAHVSSRRAIFAYLLLVSVVIS